MSSDRADYGASVLSNGQVLVAGGQNSAGIYLNSTELYDPPTGLWTITVMLNSARGFHTVSLLTNGQVLVAGGYNGVNYLNSAELYQM